MPDRTALRKALAAVKQRADYEYFFSKISSPDWLQPLLEEGLFKKPPSPIREGNYVRFPLWPESAYLARVAGENPDLAARVLFAIPETDNVRVHEDLVEVALKIGSRDAAKWAREEAK